MPHLAHIQEQYLRKGKVHFTPPNYLLCPLNPPNKILAQFTPSNNLVWLNLPPNRICLFFLLIHIIFEVQIL
uniref:Uncharacterized protein n=1 Tax=Arundo donax TaxID=35708 RepID=A0A0A9DY83_ARUDO